MKKLFPLIIMSIFINFNNVDAASCSGNRLVELQKEANRIKVNYEIVRNTITKHLYDYFNNELPETAEIEVKTIKISLSNMTNNLLIVESEKDYETYDEEIIRYGEAKTPLEFKNEKTINYKDTNNGVYSFTSDNINNYIDYKYEIYSNVSDCDVTLLKTINFRKPKFNRFSEEEICKENPKVNLCAEFITQDLTYSENNFIDAVKVRAKSNNNNNGDVEDNENEERKSLSFWDKNGKYFIIGGSILVVGVITYVVITKRRSNI